MPSATYAGRTFDVDDEGFILYGKDWTPEVGEAIAAQLSIKLTPEHWKVVNYAREDFAKSGTTPGLRRITQQAGVGMKDLYTLFPKGPAKLIAKIGGIPKPKSCL